MNFWDDWAKPVMESYKFDLPMRARRDAGLRFRVGLNPAPFNSGDEASSESRETQVSADSLSNFDDEKSHDDTGNNRPR